jgi:hypothetical protein
MAILSKPTYFFAITLADKTRYGQYAWSRQGQHVYEVSPSRATLQWGLNRAGVATLEANKLDIERHVTSSTNYPLFWYGIVPGAACLWVHRNNRPIWGGIIWDITSGSDRQTVQITAEEFTGLYDRNHLTTTIQSNQSVQNLVTTLIQLEPNASWMKHYIKKGTFSNVDGVYQMHPQWYEYENRNVGDLLRTLTDFKDGFDFYQGLVRSTDVNNSGVPEAGFITELPTAGTNYGDGSSAGAAAYYPVEWGPDTMETAEEVSYTHSARKTASFVKVTGFGDNGAALRATSTHLYPIDNLISPRMDYMHTDKELGREGGQARVNEKTTKIINVLGRPHLHVQAKIKPKANWPFLWDNSYGAPPLGSRFRTRIVDTGLNYSGLLRANQWGVELNSSGQEWILLDLAPDESAID